MTLTANPTCFSIFLLAIFWMCSCGCSPSFIDSLSSVARDQPALPPQNNASLSSLPSIDNNTVRVTPVAAAKFREAVPNSSANFVRLDITPGGCTGFEYHLTVENSIEVNDVKSDLDGFTIVTKQNFLPLLEGATIDWQTTPDGQQGFSFDCPATRPSTSP